jgi:hypothetical protein
MKDLGSDTATIKKIRRNRGRQIADVPYLPIGADGTDLLLLQHGLGSLQLFHLELKLFLLRKEAVGSVSKE